MNVISIGIKDIRKVSTTVVNNKKKGIKHHNIRHGSRGKNFWEYSIGVSSSICKVDDSEERVVLDDDNYILLPIMRKDIQVKDGRGNPMYYIDSDTQGNHDEDYLVLWNIPIIHDREIKFTVSGNAMILGNGVVGRIRNDNLLQAPAPVVEVTGSAILKWSYIDGEDLIKQTTTFNGKTWTIGEIITEKK